MSDDQDPEAEDWWWTPSADRLGREIVWWVVALLTVLFLFILAKSMYLGAYA